MPLTVPLRLRLPLLAALVLAAASHTRAALDAGAVEKIRAVGLEGSGNAAASAAWRKLAEAAPADITALLRAMNGANTLAQNWLRSAVETAAGRAAGADALPAADLTTFVEDTANDEAPRLLAYEILARHQGDSATALHPKFLEDPAASLRVFAVADLIASGQAKKDAGDKPGAVEHFTRALDAARDEEQIKVLADSLRALDAEVDLPRHFGFLMDWHLIAPFTNSDRGGFDTEFPPENEVDLGATYPGKGAEAKWTAFTSNDEYGMIDFNKPFGMLKEVTGYAFTEFHSAEERDAELRLGCKNAWKIWLNDELLFARDEYHRGMKLDQYKLPVKLRKGANRILVKCCQNEQTETWTVEWRFQLRVCDSTGTAITDSRR
jgi:hypothetical protein